MKQCKNCPFQKGMGWTGAYGSSHNAEWKIMALKHTDESGVFSCHRKHPLANVFMGKMITNDCNGFKMMQENMVNPNTHKSIVNEFNDTLPSFDLRYWAKKENYVSPLKLI